MLNTQSDRKYQQTSQLIKAIHRTSLRIEHRRLEAGFHQPGICESNELAFVLSGSTSALLTVNGATRQAVIQPGVACIIPSGAMESASANESAIECLHVYLPPTLMEQSALENYDVDPAKTVLSFVSGVRDDVLNHIATAFHSVLSRESEPTDRLFLDGLQAALVGRLLGKYTPDRWRAPVGKLELSAKRLHRVLDFIEVNFRDELSLRELAAEACLSEFHFCRLFRAATGLSPSGYVTVRRVREAKRLLELGGPPLVEIALENGFGSQANFTRVFRKATGLTPGKYRALHRG